MALLRFRALFGGDEPSGQNQDIDVYYYLKLDGKYNLQKNHLRILQKSIKDFVFNSREFGCLVANAFAPSNSTQQNVKGKFQNHLGRSIYWSLFTSKYHFRK